ncbi:carboxylesterase family protein [Yinghuangia sp. ASG 101]|uniref:carboxylesterase/lipase family protein n=1 Tax=Yinghuangia sp. ASG 101 TaxID=2896848 RepID=UPI001E2D394E|nr:carboxylesterase family protein [Yinghuangia sp. ASG 101]UGQ13962.1 carboxylesterase family protein [Yinghuangia sp. ASG 101]
MNPNSAPPVVDTTYGQLRGTAVAPGGAVFAGIPYAAPPTGPRRFRPPQPPSPWTGVRDAITFPAAPPQRSRAGSTDDQRAPAGGSGKADAEGGLPPAAALMVAARALSIDTSEDCLYLNVWTPEPGGRRPVLVWFYGGGLESGSASPPMTDGAALSRQTGAVVVTANYRVGALGWLYPAGSDREDWATGANLGLQDQAAALHWVRDNITAFGGDPGNVTIGGGSAGARSVSALLTLPAAAGTFHKAILHSRSTGRVTTPEAATAITKAVFSAVGVKDMAGIAEVPLDRLLAAQRTVIESDVATRCLPGGRRWDIVLDGTIVERDPFEAVAAGAAAHIPLLIGANRDEFTIFAALGTNYTPRDESALLTQMSLVGVRDPGRLLEAYRARIRSAAAQGSDSAPGNGTEDLAALRTLFLADAVYRIPAAELARAQAAAGGRAYSYLFSGTPLGERSGAYHGSDAMYTFDKLARLGIDNLEHRAIRDTLTGAWASFLATGDPGWPAHDTLPTPDRTRQIGGDTDWITEPAPDIADCWAGHL